MMLYLTWSTRLGIFFAVHQYSRFSHSLKRGHEIGFKHIVIYLKGTKDKGIIMEPDLDNMRIDIYAGADFSNVYTTGGGIDPISIKSRTRVLLTFENLPVLWTSNLQTELSLSTLEAEYIALSQGIRELVFARILMAKLVKHINCKLDKVSRVSKVW